MSNCNCCCHRHEPKPALTPENLSILLTKLTIMHHDAVSNLERWPNDLNHAHVRHEAEGKRWAYLDALGGIRRLLGDTPLGDLGTWPKG